MATPSIQVLITQAQQVLNLQSSNEIRATLAAVLANANVGTPLNPNLTTQQLWNEFDEIVRQSTDDILSIIVDQMMRMVFSPPAPGGAGADKQVIFNDGGVLAGDTKFLWDKTANRLDVDGPVVITGDLTVRTNKLAVTSTGVGVGIATPTAAFDIFGAFGSSTAAAVIRNSSGSSASNKAQIQFFTVNSFNGIEQVASIDGSNPNAGANNGGALVFSTSLNGTATTPAERYRIGNDGAATWSVAGTTAMTLNATGLGIGVSPNAALDVKKTLTGTASSVTNILRLDSNGIGNTSKITLSDGFTSDSFITHTGSATAANQLLGFGCQAVQQLVINTSGNVGIGVTPSAWGSTYKALQLSAGSISADSTVVIEMRQNSFWNGSANAYVNNGFASNYYQYNGTHAFFTAPSGTANNAITFTPVMTLDASGNLLVGTTSSATSSGSGFKVISPVAGHFDPFVVTSSNNVNQSCWDIYSTGGTAGYRFYVTATGTVNAINPVIAAISDARLKENVQDIDVGLAAILSLKPRKFDWKPGKGKGIKNDRGFIAQEFETVFPNLIDEWKDPAPEGEAPYKSVRQDLIPVLVKAIQELAARLQTLEAR